MKLTKQLILLILSGIMLITVTALLIFMLRSDATAGESTPTSTAGITSTTMPSTAVAASPETTVPPRETTTPPTTAPDTVPPTTVPPETTVPPTTTPPTTAPPATIQPTAPPATTPPPTADSNEYIGSLYTRGYLETLDRTSKGYGAGNNVDSRNRPVYAMQLTEKFKHFDAHFIAPDDGNIYISFNCGYEYNNLTTVVLDVLKEKDVKVVFFVNYYFVKSNPALIQRIIDEGHILANHCTNHPDLPRQSIDRIVYEIMTIHNYVLDTYGYEMKLFRPPSGYYSEQVLAIAQSLGYRTYNFSFSYRDWDEVNLPDPAETLNKLIAKAHSGAIYQLHTVSGTNAKIIGPFIDAMREQGYNFALLP